MSTAETPRPPAAPAASGTAEATPKSRAEEPAAGPAGGGAQGEAPPAPRPTCRCGHDRDHYMVSPDATYSGWGWFWLLFGVTANPRSISFKCRVCQEVIETTDDPEVMRQYPL